MTRYRLLVLVASLSGLVLSAAEPLVRPNQLGLAMLSIGDGSLRQMKLQRFWLKTGAAAVKGLSLLDMAPEK